MTATTLFTSVLDTKETLSHFSTEKCGHSSQIRDFTTAHYRYRNLFTAHILENSDHWNEDAILKAIKRLRFCKSTGTIEVNEKNQATIHKSGLTCKSAHCSICNRAKSNKLAMRFVEAYSDVDNKELFQDKHFYFLTLTVKHNEVVRKDIYLKEFNDYCNKLFRSKIWRTSFNVDQKKNQAGWIHCRECTFTKNGYHIHAHIIVCSSKIKSKAKELENELRNKWKKITKDSTGVRLDLLKRLYKFDKQGKRMIDNGQLIRTVKELFKYGTKIGKIHSEDTERINMFAKWIIKTKGQNFVNASGLFRKLGITGATSKYDKKIERKEKKENCTYHFGPISKIKFLVSPVGDIPKNEKKEVLDLACISAIDDHFKEVTDIYDLMQDYHRVGLTDKQYNDLIDGWILHAKKLKSELDQNEALLTEEKEELKKRTERMKQQIKMFELPKSENKSTQFLSNY